MMVILYFLNINNLIKYMLKVRFVGGSKHNQFLKVPNVPEIGFNNGEVYIKILICTCMGSNSFEYHLNNDIKYLNGKPIAPYYVKICPGWFSCVLESIGKNPLKEWFS